MRPLAATCLRERESVIDSLLVRIHLIIVMIRFTGPTPWEFEFPFPGSLTSTFLVYLLQVWGSGLGLGQGCRFHDVGFQISDLGAGVLGYLFASGQMLVLRSGIKQ